MSILIEKNRGTYALILHLVQNSDIKIGALGIFNFQAGFYVYVGSAFGPGGLQARLSHHTTPARRLHWHIDYFRQQANILELWFTYDLTRQEHAWAHVFSGFPDSIVPCFRFGATDCHCPSHLLFYQVLPDFRQFGMQLRKQNPVHEAVQRVLPSTFTSDESLFRSIIISG